MFLIIYISISGFIILVSLPPPPHSFSPNFPFFSHLSPRSVSYLGGETRHPPPKLLRFSADGTATPPRSHSGDPPVKLQKAKCKRCGALLAADSKKNGTTSLNKHIISCSKKHKAKSSQSLLKQGRDYYLLPREALQDDNE